MASYGGYSQTAYGGGDDGGGYMSASQQGSQGETKKRFQDETLRPVTIKQILDLKEPYPGSDMQLDGAPLTHLTLVGQVRSVNPQATNITYRIDDGTGLIDVKKWIDADKVDEDGAEIPPDTYVRVHGRLSNFNNKRHVTALKVRPIGDFNEVNYHLLEATYVHLVLTRGGKQGQRPDDGGDGMFVDGGYGTAARTGGGGGRYSDEVQAKLNMCSKNAVRVFDFLANYADAGNDGAHANVVAGAISMGYRDVLAAGDELLQAGLVYHTADDETWAVMEV
ncbi:hypothetical protein VTK26DRAFT_7290 [Humicola hyalothermophila]